jgi:branched-chain amino acid transport system substrate-binding protein
MWVEDINKRGGILGRPVQLIIYDDQSDVKVIYNDYLRLITVDKVDLLIGTTISALGQAIEPLFEQYRIAVIHPTVSALTPGVQWSFSLVPWAGVNSYPFIDMLNTFAPKPQTMVILSESSAFPVGIAGAARNYSLAKGFQVLDYEQFSPTTTDFTSVLTKVKSLNPDILVGCGYPQEAVLMKKQMDGIGFAPKAFWFYSGPTSPAFISGLGAASSGVWTVSPWMPSPYLKGSDIESYTKTFASRYGGVLPDYTAAAVYVAAEATAQAAIKVGSIDNAKIRDYLASVDTTILGWKINFDPTTHQDNKAIMVIQIQSSNWVVISPPELSSGTPQYPCPTACH